MSTVSIRSLTAIGTPCSGPRGGSLSRRRASASACSLSRYCQACTTSSRAAMRSRQARVNASEESRPAAISSAAIRADSEAGSGMAAAGQDARRADPNAGAADAKGNSGAPGAGLAEAVRRRHLATMSGNDRDQGRDSDGHDDGNDSRRPALIGLAVVGLLVVIGYFLMTTLRQN